MRILNRVGAVLALACCLPTLAIAQEPGRESTEGRLLQILREKGIISETEHDELKALEKQMREEQSIEGELSDRISELVAIAEDASPTLAHRPGRGFSWTTPDKNFRLQIGGRIQVRFTHDIWEDNPSTDNENRPDFDVTRARLDFSGNAFQTYIKYKFQFDLAGDEADTNVTFPGGGGSSVFASRNRLTELKDAFIDFDKWPAFKVRFGQFKVPYSRQFLTSSGSMELVDRSPIDSAFSRGRDSGLMVFGDVGTEENSRLFEYYIGIFDGEGENLTNNDKGLLYAARIAVNPFGEVAYSQSDLKHTEDFRLALGLNAWLHQDDNHASQEDDWSIGADLAMFWQSFFLTIEVHYRENGTSTANDVELFGWSAQAGYFILPAELEISLRYAEIDWDNNGTGTSAQREYLLGLGYFWEGHAMKLQADFGRVENHRGNTDLNTDEWRFRLQFQLIF
jgi:hypothetical protein